jgi:UDP-glucose 4-epimerase
MEDLMKSMKRLPQSILVTGGLGYVGSHVTLDLLSRGCRVQIVDDLSNSCISRVSTIEEYAQQKVPFTKVDLSDHKSLTKLSLLFERQEFDAVIHCAGKKIPFESIQEPLMYYRSNVLGTINLLEIMSRFSVTNLIFSSSASVYDYKFLPSEKRKETYPLKPLSPYGKTKILSEEILRDVCQADRRWNIVALRYFNPVGAHPSYIIGDSLGSKQANLFCHLMRASFGIQKELHIYGNDYESMGMTMTRQMEQQ